MSFEPISLKSKKPNLTRWVLVLGAALLIIIGLAYWRFGYVFAGVSARWDKYQAWQADPSTLAEFTLLPGERCADAPFAFPTKGVIFGSWGQHYRPGHTHTGLDIFAGTDLNVTPVYAAYDGYLTRLEDWRSALIIRIPNDPLQPNRQIWTYYTHMADEQGNSFISAAFPAGTSEVFVEAGTLLGYQGNYSGNPGNPTGLHLHISIVKDDGKGSFLNETDIDNTLDLTPYFNLP
ncbi:MAG: M23 family metallopeptidase, partial [Chloroflexota bacterium]